MTVFRPRPAALLLLLALAAALAIVGSAGASDPATQAVTVPPPGPATTLTWKGTIPSGTNPAGGCSADLATNDTHKITFAVPAGIYDAAVTKATFTISWDKAENDEIIQVDGPGGFSDVGDTEATTEVVEVPNPVAGEYTVTACPYGGAVPTPVGPVGPTTTQDYIGRLTVKTTAEGGAGAGGTEADVPSSDAKGLAFSASVPSDPQRDVSEPLLETDPGGRSYTCGPTGFSNVSDYSNTSDDGGDQFHLLGTQPRGQQGSGGGGDCGLGTGVKKNSAGNYQYAYAGLGPLTGFTTSTSPDDGRTLYTAGPQGNTNTAQGGLADRQWLTFLNDKDVLLNYNQQMPRNVVVQKSTDGGQTYITGNDVVAAGSPDFPGPMRTMPASIVDPGAPAGSRIAYFAWNTSDADFGYVNLSISDPTGLTWTNCLAHKQKLSDGALQAFTVADNDDAGNVYIAYADESAFHTNLVTLDHADLKNCNESVHPATAASTGAPPTKNPGFSDPIRVDRDKVRTTIFPWLVAGGAPGHVALSYYGTESDGDPNPGSFKASWDVYVDQLTDAPIGAKDNAKIPAAAVGQVKATTHPVHYDSICLLGLNCDLSVPAGDRGLGDFFAIDLNPRTRKLQLVYNNTAKLPDEAGGSVAAPMVVTQIGGPSGAGGNAIAPEADRAVVRTTAPDPVGDALVDYSFLNGPTASAGGVSGAQTEVKALDLRDTVVGPEVDPETGEAVENGGITVTMTASDLSAAALATATDQTTSGGSSLVYAFRFVNGFQPAAAVAKYDGSAFTFGFDDYTVASTQCGSSQGPKCEIYPGATEIKGKVDQVRGTITLSVPRKLLHPLKGTTGPGERPSQKAAGGAVPGDRFYDATAISFANPSPDPATQGFMVNADNVRAFDFVLPGTTAAGNGSGTPVPGPGAAGSDSPAGSGSGSAGSNSPAGSGSPASPTVTPAGPTRPSAATKRVPAACIAGGGFRTAGVKPVGRSVRFAFSRKIRAKATISVFQQSSGRSITGERLVARFVGKARSFTWNGKATRSKRVVADGFYFARYTIGSGKTKDIRRVVLMRRNGRFVKRSDFYRRATCDALPSFKLERPVFGGRTNRPLNVSFRLAKAARVTVTVLRGGRTIKRFGPTARRANVTQRLRLGSDKLARGNYTVRIAVPVSGGKTLTTALVGRRL